MTTARLVRRPLRRSKSPRLILKLNIHIQRYLIEMDAPSAPSRDDDEAEGRVDARDARDSRDDRDKPGKGKDKKRQKQKGQNVERDFGKFDDAIRICNSRAYASEFSPKECKFGDRCKLSHDLRQYLKEGRREDVVNEAFNGKCPIFERYGKCASGWKCRFVGSHMEEVKHEDGRMELVLLPREESTASKAEDGESETKSDEKPETEAKPEDTKMDESAGEAPAEPKMNPKPIDDESRHGITNIVDMSIKIDLNRKRVDFKETDSYMDWLNKESKINDTFHQRKRDQSLESMEDLRAQFVDPPFKPSEKRRLYFGPETPALAPLTTQGNLPFRRLCVELGAQLTYSEMAMSGPLMQGMKSDWTLLKAHESEITPPTINPSSRTILFDDYSNSTDLKFGAQISAAQPWVAIKATNALARFVPHLRLIDLNCGCPIDMIFKSGGGSALLESSGKLERIVRGMNTFSGDIPVTAKIRTGVKNNRPTAQQVIGKLAFGSREHRERLGAPGCAAITLHGRSREQRYTKRADWGFIGECAALIKSYNEQKAALTDTVREPDAATLPNSKDGRMYFLGNGDCFSHVDHQNAIDNAKVDSVMVGRGALIKPWVFEEIQTGQYLDKSASERLTYIEKFVRYGLEAWGSDELGIGFTRRFLLEWLSFTHRYVPIGLLEVLPPSLNDRPPNYRGRNELETLMASESYLDWIKIT